MPLTGLVSAGLYFMRVAQPPMLHTHIEQWITVIIVSIAPINWVILKIDAATL